jgi:periplasmic divalent cation tolerance protein
MPTPDAAVVFTTLGSHDDAAAFVQALLDRRLIACGTILPGARSLYRWEGKIANELEAFVVLKTSAARIPELETAFTELHPYKVFELLALPVAAGSPRYLDWIGAETTLPAST